MTDMTRCHKCGRETHYTWDCGPGPPRSPAHSRELTPERKAEQTRMLESVYPGLFRQEGSDGEVG